MRLNDTDILLYKFTVSMVSTLAGEGAGGQTSSTTTIESGIKPKVLNCSGSIAKKNPERLTALTALSEALDDKGDRVIYDIVDETASATNIRQVVFFDVITASSDEAIKKWKVSFSLIEKNSVAEAKQNQKIETDVLIQGENGGSVKAQGNNEEQLSTEGAAGTLSVGNIEQFLIAGEKLAAKFFGDN